MDKENIFKNFLSQLPELPGVYQYYNDLNQIIYIGKAKNLKRRVSSYFYKNHKIAKLRILVRQIHRIEYIIVESETDALLLENNLIKKFKPRYNVLLKDDKTYPWIVIKKEDFPRIYLTRNKISNDGIYFGPFSSVRTVRYLIELIKMIYKPRTCNLKLSIDKISTNSFKPCLEYHLKNCIAPCIGLQSSDDYNLNILLIQKILKGNITEVINYLKSQLDIFSLSMQYELAHETNEKINLLTNYKSKSTIVNPGISNVEVFAIINEEKIAYVYCFRIINGAIIQSQGIEIKKRLSETNEHILRLAIINFHQILNINLYDINEIIIPYKINLKFEGIKFTIPKKGDKLTLLNLCIKNLKLYRQEKILNAKNTDPNKFKNKILTDLMNDLGMNEIPKHIECFDNSNFQGSYPVSSCVVFKNGKPSKKDYRHFNVKSVDNINDFATMEEVVYRRYKRLLDENNDLPQLIIIDGGKGQLSSALNSLQKLEIDKKIKIIGIAKKLDEIFIPGESLPIYLKKNSNSLKLIQQARDEAHRFGITFHRNKRSKGSLKSDLENINGVGEKTIQLLLKTFKSYNTIKNLNINDLKQVIGESKAIKVFNYINNKENNKSNV